MGSSVSTGDVRAKYAPKLKARGAGGVLGGGAEERPTCKDFSTGGSYLLYPII